MTKLNDDTRAVLENTIREYKKQVEIIDAQIEEELARVKETINALQEQKKIFRQIYDSAALMLGAKNEFEDENDDKMDQ